jgi:hypothetical protein
MPSLKTLFTNKQARERAAARALEIGEALAEKSGAIKIFGNSIGPQFKAISQNDNDALNQKLEDTAQKLKALHIETGEKHLAVAVTVGRGLTAHVHEFHSTYNWKAHRVDFSFYDPESYIGRRRTLSPEISQWLKASVRLAKNGRRKMSFMRLSARNEAGQQFRGMHHIKSASEEFHRQTSLTQMQGTPVYYAAHLNGNARQTTTKIASHHPLQGTNHFARQAQLIRTLKYIDTLISSDNLKPLSPTGEITRHCEPGATCTPTRLPQKKSFSALLRRR